MANHIDKTLNYYEKNVQNYFKEWNDEFLQNYDFTVPNIFLSYLNNNAHILDLGCEFSRNSKYFLNINFENEFDGVFACASLLHLNNEDLKTALFKISKALKNKGIFFCSFIIK